MSIWQLLAYASGAAMLIILAIVVYSLIDIIRKTKP